MAAIAFPVSTRGWRGPAAPADAGRGREVARRSAPRSHAGSPQQREPVEIRERRRAPGSQLRLVAPVAMQPSRPSIRAGRRAPRALRHRTWSRLVPALLTVSVLGGVWLGAGALTSSRQPQLVAPAGAQATPGGYRYVVRPGDTVWSIASAMEPGADPRALVDQLDAELPGGVLRVGAVLHLP